MKRILFGLLICFCHSAVVALAFDIRHLRNNEGLSNSSVNAIFQDSSQLMWFGTWDGLNMYNGTDFKVFKPELHSSNSISNNIIRSIREQSEGVLWIATDNGINRYVRNENRMDRYFYKTMGNPVFKERSFNIVLNDKKQVFAHVYGAGLHIFNPDSNAFIPVLPELVSFVQKMIFDKDGNLWVLTDDSLLQFAFSAEDRTLQSVQKKSFELLKNISSLFFDGDHKMWMQQRSGQLYCYDTANSKLEKINAWDYSEPINAMLFEKTGCYIGTPKGLVFLAYDTNQIQPVMNGISVWSLFQGTQQILWVGTDAKGIFLLSPPGEKFHSFTEKEIPALAGNPVRAFSESDPNSLWLGTKGAGLFHIETISKEKESIVVRQHFSTENGLQNNSVYSLATTRTECWIGTEGEGLNYFHFKSNRLELLKVPAGWKDKNANPKCIYTIYPQNDSVIWVGTSGYGLYRLIVDKSASPYTLKSYKQYVYQNNSGNINNNIVYSIIPDGDSDLWIGTRGGGLNRLNINEGVFTHYRHSVENSSSLSSDDVLCLYKDKQGTLWVGTSIGLNRLVEIKAKNAVFERYTESEGIPNNTIHGILEDSNKNVWISTNKGIAKITPSSGKIVAYFASDGLQDNEFSDGAYYCGQHSGNFYFGGINGYSKFNPSKITDADYMPSLYLSAFSVNNQEVLLNDYMHTSHGKSYLEMGYNEKFFSFKFTPLDYLAASKCELAYKLENYQNEWVMLGTSGTIVFSNLPAGSYVLKVKWSNADKSWSSAEYTIPLKILPPYWRSSWANIVYALFGLLILYIIYRVAKQRIKSKQDLQLQQLEKKQIEEIHQAKLRFFTNIAHEFCNSLTLIYGPCEQLLKISDNFLVRKYTHIIYSNAERMQGLIQQLMDFRKVETGHLDVVIETIDIQEFVRYTMDHFTDIAEQKNIHIDVLIQPEISSWATDRSSFEKILFNLLSNAFKYTPEDKDITIQVGRKERFLQLIVTNTGIGIKPEDQKMIFNRFKMLDRFENQLSKGFVSTGIGLALCKSLATLLQGSIRVKSDAVNYTSFIVELPEMKIPEKKVSDLSIAPISLLLPDKSGIPGEKIKVLIVEDDKDIRDLLHDTMKEEYAISEAANGIEALDCMKGEIPDIIVTDIYMPGMDGIEFVRKLKEQEMTSFIPVIFLSSESSEELQLTGIREGVDAFLSKPFQTKHLEAAIDNILRTRKKLKNYYDSPFAGIEPLDGKLVHREEKEFILNLTKIIFENLEKEKLSLDMLAADIRMSKIQLYRKLKAISGQTPTEFIRQIRLKQAEKLLRTTNKTVQEIMYNCGFNNKTYFYREFAKMYHKTPKEYRNSMP